MTTERKPELRRSTHVVEPPPDEQPVTPHTKPGWSNSPQSAPAPPPAAAANTEAPAPGWSNAPAKE